MAPVRFRAPPLVSPPNLIRGADDLILRRLAGLMRSAAWPNSRTNTQQLCQYLGPTEKKIKGIKIKRKDIELVNKRGFKIQCSHYEHVQRPADQMPCVIYLHGNSSSRLEAIQCLDVLIPQFITLFSLDFSGCGVSEGEYISLGWYERDDVEAVVDYLRKSNRVSTIGLWGNASSASAAHTHARVDLSARPCVSSAMPRFSASVLRVPFSAPSQKMKKI